MSVDVECMRRDAEILRAVAAVLRAHLLTQQRAVVRLTSAWSGAAADEALTSLRRRLERARTECGAVAAAAETLDDAADLIRDARSERDTHLERIEERPLPSPGAGAPPVRACPIALAELFDVVDLVVDGARAVAERVVADLGAEAVEEPRAPVVPALVPAPAAAAAAVDMAAVEVPVVDMAAAEVPVVDMAAAGVPEPVAAAQPDARDSGAELADAGPL